MERGFNLIESAIVLGVVGLVIGGIWVAASAVAEKFRLDEASIGVLQIYQGLCKSFPRRMWTQSGSDILLGDYVVAAKIAPENLITGDGDLQTPWGKDLNVGFWDLAEPRLHIGLMDLTESQCRHLVSSISARFAGTGDTQLYLLYFHGADTTVRPPWPVSFDTSLCNGGESVNFSFRPCANGG